MIPVHDFGEINGVLYIDMRLVEGDDLHAELRQERPARSGAGRVDRRTGGRGARRRAREAGSSTATSSRRMSCSPATTSRISSTSASRTVGGESGLTSAGAAIGSCAYMAPERFTGGRVGPAADIYSLACLLYECLTGSAAVPDRRIESTDGRSHHVAATAAERDAARAHRRIRCRRHARHGQATRGAVLDRPVTWLARPTPRHRRRRYRRRSTLMTRRDGRPPIGFAATPPRLKVRPREQVSAQASGCWPVRRSECSRR